MIGWVGIGGAVKNAPRVKQANRRGISVGVRTKRIQDILFPPPSGRHSRSKDDSSCFGTTICPSVERTLRIADKPPVRCGAVGPVLERVNLALCPFTTLLGRWFKLKDRAATLTGVMSTVVTTALSRS